MNIYLILYYLSAVFASLSLFWVIFIILSAMKLGSYLFKHDSQNAPVSRYSFMVPGKMNGSLHEWITYLLPFVLFVSKDEKDKRLIKLVSRVRLFLVLSIGCMVLAVLLSYVWKGKV